MTESKRGAGYKKIGEFIFQFSQLEFSIRVALSAALNLSDEHFDIVTAPYDFAILCTVTNIILIQKHPAEKATIERLFKDCRTLNDERVKVAHGLWTLGKDGLIARHVARNSLKRNYYFDDPSALTRLADEAQRLNVILLELGRAAASKRPNVKRIGVERLPPDRTIKK